MPVTMHGMAFGRTWSGVSGPWKTINKVNQQMSSLDEGS